MTLKKQIGDNLVIVCVEPTGSESVPFRLTVQKDGGPDDMFTPAQLDFVALSISTLSLKARAGEVRL